MTKKIPHFTALWQGKEFAPKGPCLVNFELLKVHTISGRCENTNNIKIIPWKEIADDGEEKDS